jgi:hypothetical protein
MVSCGQHLLQRQACYAVPDCCDLKPAADQADRLDSINWIVTSDGSCSAGSYRIQFDGNFHDLEGPRLRAVESAVVRRQAAERMAELLFMSVMCAQSRAVCSTVLRVPLLSEHLVEDRQH